MERAGNGGKSVMLRAGRAGGAGNGAGIPGEVLGRSWMPWEGVWISLEEQ